MISAYHIEITDSNSLWQTHSECDGTDAQIISSLRCVVSMDTLSLTYGLQFDETVIVRVSASNSMGQGAWSLSNSVGAKLRQRPVKMTQVTKDPTSTETTLTIVWSGLTSGLDTGNSDILAYEVYWDANTGAINILLHDEITLAHLVERLEPGLTYQFKVRARNIYGYGPFSDVSSLIPDAEPATMDAVVTSLEYPTV